MVQKPLDATWLGIRKNFLPMFVGNDTSGEYSVEGSRHKDCVMVKTSKLRKKNLTLCTDGLECDVFQCVLQKGMLLLQMYWVSLLEVLIKIIELLYLMWTFGELCKNSPVSSLHQNDTGLPILENVVHQKIDIRKSAFTAESVSLMKVAPVFGNFY